MLISLVRIKEVFASQGNIVRVVDIEIMENRIQNLSKSHNGILSGKAFGRVVKYYITTKSRNENVYFYVSGILFNSASDEKLE